MGVNGVSVGGETGGFGVGVELECKLWVVIGGEVSLCFSI